MDNLNLDSKKTVMIQCSDDAEWKAQRLNYLTASDAGNVCGMNPYDPNGKLHLWEEKTGLKAKADISGKPQVQFGKKAEQHLRALFMLRHPEYELKYDEFGLYVAQDILYKGKPFMASTLDGLLVPHESRRLAHLEVKTGTVHDRAALEEWETGILPVNYWLQVLWQFATAKTDEAWVFGYISKEWDPNRANIYEWHYNREDDAVQQDLPLLIDNAREFWGLVQTKTRPSTTIRL